MISKVLIANRGEIACRIARTCRARGISVAGVHSDADANALHVREIGESWHIGGSAPADSYLNMDAILQAARDAGANAIHPGFGFLSENPEFAQRVEDAGLIFIGPTSETLNRLGRKDSAKEIAGNCGIPVIVGGTHASDDPESIRAAALQVCLPALLKAAAGGGGRGMRVVTDEAELDGAITSAMREAENAFGLPDLIVEQYIPRGRHIEVQIAGDGKGRVIHLHERECTLQRRHQKVIEEAPAAPMPEPIRQKMLADAIKIGEALNFRNLGTVEFLLAGEDYYFLEVNPRLQVEHPVTEEVTGLDLVALQLQIAGHGTLDLSQSDITLNGHAVEARLYAEDPANGFAPSVGCLGTVTLPAAPIRVEAGVATGDDVTPFYDSMIAKIIAHAADRDEAMNRLDDALNGTRVQGLVTNRLFLKKLLALPETRDGSFWTTQIDDQAIAGSVATSLPDIAIAAAVWLFEQPGRDTTDPWQNWQGAGWQLNTGEPRESTGHVAIFETGEQAFHIRHGQVSADGEVGISVNDARFDIRVQPLVGNDYMIRAGRQTRVVSVELSGEQISLNGPETQLTGTIRHALAGLSTGATSDGALEAPLIGQIMSVHVAEGDMVAEGDVIAIMESMKMEVRIPAPKSGRLVRLSVDVGDMVSRGDPLGEIETA